MNANKKPNQKPKVVPIRKRWYHSPFYSTLWHLVSTAATAAVIGLVAYGLDHLALWMEAQKASEFLVSGFHLFANALFVFDCAWFLVNVLRGIYHDWFDK